MRQVKVWEEVSYPKQVEITVRNRKVTVKGPRGTVTRKFHSNLVDIYKVGQKRVRVEKWFGARRDNAAVKTVTTHIANMIKGVQFGFKYTMRSVYAHFPININVKGEIVEIRNFLGEKRLREVPLEEGVTFQSSGQKDEYLVQGIDLERVSKTAALLQQSTTVKNKDIRKFLDGIYVSARGTVLDQEA